MAFAKGNAIPGCGAGGRQAPGATGPPHGAPGTPVLCSDLPALREVGGGVPEYFDPLDGPGWLLA